MKLKCAASVIITYDNNALMRPEGKRFQLIGGKSCRKKSPVDTALRETWEEAGLRLDPKRLELIHEHKERRIKHTFFLYRLTEPEATGNFTPATSTKQPRWLIMTHLRKQMFHWWGYWRAIRVARKRLYMNLLSFVPAT